MEPSKGSWLSFEDGFYGAESGDLNSESPFIALLRRVRPQVAGVLERHRVPAKEANEILHETLQTLAWKWETVRDREAWLLAILERKCVSLSEKAAGATPR